MNNQYYNDLFERLLEGKLSPEETDQLLEWLNREDTTGEAASVIATRLKRLVTENEITPEIRNALQARLPLVLAAKRERGVVRMFRQTWFKYSAAAVLIIAVGFFLWSTGQKRVTTPSRDKPVATNTKTDIAPGSQGAILTLADGRQVVLDSLGNGVVADQTGTQVTLQDGKLLYNALPTADSRLTYNTISTPKGRQFQLVLPDQTKVWLNAASSLTYPTRFSGKERRVAVKGEAYFEVASLSLSSTGGGGKMPFIVTIPPQPGGLGGASVRVLGTHFNINSYSDEPAIKTTLLEGSVKIVNTAIDNPRPTGSSGRGQSAMLKPGQQAVLTADSRLTIHDKVDVDKVMAWKNGVFNFEEATLQEVMHQLERWYDIEVQYEAGIPKLEFVGKMGRDLALSDVLRGLELNKVHFRLEGRKLIVLP